MNKIEELITEIERLHDLVRHKDKIIWGLEEKIEQLESDIVVLKSSDR